MNVLTMRHAVLGALLAGVAGAGLCRALPAEAAKAESKSATPAPPARAVDGWGSPAKLDKLSGSRGGTDTVVVDAKLSGNVANNTATNVFTGNNSIAGGSFANMAGLPMVIQNTGANVLIQNATVVNLQLK